jgi:beta-glucosidase
VSKSSATPRPDDAARAEPSRFPSDFLWGAATSAYQIEGSPLADGAGPSIWHRFAHSPGHVTGDETGDVACDHYRRWEDDLALLARLRLNAYRFSVSWSRILPEGRGAVNPAGIGFYDRLVDQLCALGITPLVTLYHWDLPAALDDRGGWCNPDVAHWFADYAAVLFRALGDRVTLWATVNEPWVVVDAGYLFGVHAPGHRNLYEAPRASHHLLLAHAEAVRAYRAASGRGRIGIVVNLEPKEPASDAPEDRQATRRADAYMNRSYLDPLFLGSYPEELREIFGDAWPEFPEAEMRAIREPVDFLGVNYYKRGITRHDVSSRPLGFSSVDPPGALCTRLGWEVHAPGLGRTLRWVHDRYGAIPIYVTENGAAFEDPDEAVGGRVDDPLRVEYLRSHLQQVRDARRDGVDVRGYFAWSFLDNFEWGHGHTMRFGLVHVNYRTQERTPKASAFAYRAIVESGGAVLDAGPEELMRRADELRGGDMGGR